MEKSSWLSVLRSNVKSEGHTLGVGESVEDGQAHVGDGDLREDAAVDKFDERVDGGLGVDGGLHLRRRQGEEAAGLDDLEALVHQGGGVDRDALTHDPGGVFERLLGGDVLEVAEWGVAEGATGGGEPDLLDLLRGLRRACTGGRRCARSRWGAALRCALWRRR